MQLINKLQLKSYKTFLKYFTPRSNDEEMHNATIEKNDMHLSGYNVLRVICTIQYLH